MGALSLIQSAMTRIHVPEVGNTALATRSMGNSASAMEVLAKGNQQGNQAMKLAVHTIGQKRSTQATTAQLGKQFGQVKGWADQQATLNKIIKDGAADWARGSKFQADSAKVIAKTSQDVAIGNSEAQYTTYKGHSAANVAVAVNQSAYGGSGWSA